MKVVALKLVSSEEVVAEEVFLNTDHIGIRKPLLMLNGAVVDGKLTKQFVPWAAHMENGTVTIDLRSVMYHGLPLKELADYYEKITGESVIVTPPAGINRNIRLAN